MGKKIEVITAKGSYYEVGFSVGEKTRDKILELIDSFDQIKLNDKKNLERFEMFLSNIKKYPNVVQQLKGMADGSGASFEDLAKLNTVELNKKIPENCSAFIVKKKEGYIIGHNEDARSYNNIYLLKAEYPDIKIISMCYYGGLPGLSANLNSYGLFMSLYSSSSNDSKMGTPKRVVANMLLSCKNFDDAVELLRNTERALGQSFIFAQGSDVWVVESSATDLFIQKIEGSFYHCNNYLFKPMKKYEDRKFGTSTFKRSSEALRVYKELKTLEDIKRELSSHINEQDSICRHGTSPGKNKTLGSFFYDSDKNKIWVGFGPTCQAQLIEVEQNWN